LDDRIASHTHIKQSKNITLILKSKYLTICWSWVGVLVSVGVVVLVGVNVGVAVFVGDKVGVCVGVGVGHATEAILNSLVIPLDGFV
jgi:hypothetical protein